MPTESRTINDHWAQGRVSSGSEGGADRNPSRTCSAVIFADQDVCGAGDLMFGDLNSVR